MSEGPAGGRSGCLILCLSNGFKDILAEPFTPNRAVVAFDIGVLRKRCLDSTFPVLA
jgi:hypothetical protein